MSFLMFAIELRIKERDAFTENYRTKRLENNTLFLMETGPEFRAKAAELLTALEADGYSPAIKEAWRPLDEQRRTAEAGHSEVLFGRHNETDLEGAPSSTAIDLNPGFPDGPSRLKYIAAIARRAEALGLETGMMWGLSGSERRELAGKLHSSQLLDSKIGWDPFHIQLRRQCHLEAPDQSSVLQSPSVPLPIQHSKTLTLLVIKDDSCQYSRNFTEQTEFGIPGIDVILVDYLLLLPQPGLVPLEGPHYCKFTHPVAKLAILEECNRLLPGWRRRRFPQSPKESDLLTALKSQVMNGLPTLYLGPIRIEGYRSTSVIKAIGARLGSHKGKLENIDLAPWP